MVWTTQHPPASLAVPLIEAVYSDNDVGCCLHVVLDDYNLQTECIVDSRQSKTHYRYDGARVSKNHPICQRCDDCAKMLLLLSMTARRKAVAIQSLASIRRMHAEREAYPAKPGWVRLSTVHQEEV